MSNFKWHDKKRLNEQVEFFGGTIKKFVSCYAKQVKVRVRVKVELVKIVNPYKPYKHPSQIDYDLIMRRNMAAQMNAQAKMISVQAAYHSNLAAIHLRAYPQFNHGLAGGLGCAAGASAWGAL